MSKRFTETTKWADPWYRKASPKIKCLWQFLCDNCDNAGVWKIDYEMASFCVGEPITHKDIESINDTTKDRIIFANKDYLIVKDFIPFQIGTLNTDNLNNLKRNCIALLNAYKDKGIDILRLIFTGKLPVGYANLTGIGKGKDKGIGKDKDNEGEMKTPQKEMFDHYKQEWSKSREGSPLINHARDGKIAQTLWRQCLRDCGGDKGKAMMMFKKRSSEIMAQFHINNFSALSSFWNAGAKKKKKVDPMDVA